MKDPMTLPRCEIDCEIALLMGYEARIEQDHCLIEHGKLYEPTRNIDHAWPAVQRFKIPIMSADLDLSMRRFLTFHHFSRLSA